MNPRHDRDWQLAFPLIIGQKFVAPTPPTVTTDFSLPRLGDATILDSASFNQAGILPVVDRAENREESLAILLGVGRDGDDANEVRKHDEAESGGE